MKVKDLLHRTIAGYRLQEVLGRGGMSVVFLAQRLEEPQEKAAIKILIPPDLSTAEEFATFQMRFLREAQVVQQLHHQNILQMLDYGEEDGVFYMLMPAISGGSLEHKVSTSVFLPLDTIADYLNQLANAVDYANQQGMVHRDIKPSNVLLDEQGKIYLADFGIVRLFERNHLALGQMPTTLTTPGQIYGTPAYMAPERFQGKPAEPATDIYALGVLLYQLVTGKVPFDADNPLAVGLKHLNAEPMPPRILRPDLPAPAEAALLKALSKKPAERFTTAAVLAAAFEAGLRGEWAKELHPFALALAESPTEKQIKPLLATQPDRFMPASARGGMPLALIPTDGNVPIMTRPESHFWRNVQISVFVLLGLVLLVFVGVLGFAVYKLSTPAAPAPGIHAQPTSPIAVPTKVSATPLPSVGITPTPGSKPTSAPTPTAGTTSTPTPTSTAGTTPTPTTGTTPTPGATAGSTP